MLKDLKRPAGKQPAGKNPKLRNFEKQFGLGSGSKKKVWVGSGGGYSSRPGLLQRIKQPSSLDLFMTFFHRLQPYLCSKQETCVLQAGHTHTGDLTMSLFFTFRSTVHEWKCPKNGLFWPNMAGFSTFQSGLKGTKMVKISVLDHLGPFWAYLDHCRQK